VLQQLIRVPCEMQCASHASCSAASDQENSTVQQSNSISLLWTITSDSKMDIYTFISAKWQLSIL